MQPEEMQFSYDVISNRPLNPDFFMEYGVNPDSYLAFSDGSGYMVFATDEVISRLESSPVITSVSKRIEREGVADTTIFPANTSYKWNRDFYGPLKVPSKGETIQLTAENLQKYFFTIQKYEGHESVVMQDESLILHMRILVNMVNPVGI